MSLWSFWIAETHNRMHMTGVFWCDVTCGRNENIHMPKYASIQWISLSNLYDMTCVWLCANINVYTHPMQNIRYIHVDVYLCLLRIQNMHMNDLMGIFMTFLLAAFYSKFCSHLDQAGKSPSVIGDTCSNGCGFPLPLLVFRALAQHQYIFQESQIIKFLWPKPCNDA